MSNEGMFGTKKHAGSLFGTQKKPSMGKVGKYNPAGEGAANLMRPGTSVPQDESAYLEKQEKTEKIRKLQEKLPKKLRGTAYYRS